MPRHAIRGADGRFRAGTGAKASPPRRWDAIDVLTIALLVVTLAAGVLHLKGGIR